MDVTTINGVERKIFACGMMPGKLSQDCRLVPFLSGFKELNSEELLPVRFKRRYSSKFILSEDILLKILPELKEYFSLVVQPGGIFRPINFRYYDTKDFRFFLDHVNGKNARLKLRLRIGNEREPDELEIWSRLNKGSMVKDRFPVNDSWPEFHRSIIPALYFEGGTIPELHASLDVVYNRFSFLRNDSGERIIIDTGISFFKPDGSITEFSYKNLIFAEVRRKRNQKSIFESTLKKENIRKTGFSKYCLGIALIEPGLKSNACKPVFRIIEIY